MFRKINQPRYFCNMTKDAETYFIAGCGRCSLGGTPECKVHTWHAELAALRHIILDCGLTEDCKWGNPVYTYEGKNILMLFAFKDNCCLSFFKGSLLSDELGILTFAGDNSYVAKIARFTRLGDINTHADALKSYIFEAVEIEKAGLKPQKSALPALPDELLHKFTEAPGLKAAFEALTPGRQRGYLMFFSAPKQSATRSARIEKSMPAIFEGKGIHD